MVANIIKIFETCKLFWPESEDFVNSATVFVNSATPRGRAIKAPAWIVLIGALPHKKSLRMECAEGVSYGFISLNIATSSSKRLTISSNCG